MYYHYIEGREGKGSWEYIIDINLTEKPAKFPTVFWFRHQFSNGWVDNRSNRLNWDWGVRKHLPLKNVLTEEELFVEVL